MKIPLVGVGSGGKMFGADTEAIEYHSNFTSKFSIPHSSLQSPANMLESSQINEPLLAEIENRDNIFQEIDYRIYRR